MDKQKTSAAGLIALSAVAQAVAITLAGMAMAHAQTTPAPAPAPVAQTEAEKKAEADKKKKEEEAQKLQRITVTGIRKGIEDAISVKKNAESIVESISAEDIGKLPDPSVADSIARLPGVTAQRNPNSGRAQSVSVRGLSPDFNSGTLNGRELASSGDSRGIEFDQFPGELIAGATVYKTPHAGVLNQGLASTIDLQTVRPLNFPKRAIAVNYRSQKTGVGQPGGKEAEGNGDRFSVSYIDQFADRKLGVALGYAKFKEKGAKQPTFNSWGGCQSTATFNGENVQIPCGFGADTETRDLDRDGVFAAFQFKPSSNFEVALDVFQSKGTGGLKKTGIEGSLQSAGGYDPAGALTAATLVANPNGGNRVVAAGTVSEYNGVIRNHIEGTIDELTAAGLNVKGKVGGWTLTGDLSFSENSRTGERYETTAGQAGNTPSAQRGSLSWTGYNGTNPTDVRYTTSLNYSDPAVARLTDVNGWGGGVGSPQAGYVAAPTIEDKITAARLTGRTDVSLGPISSVELGLNLNDRSKEATSAEGFLVLSATDPYAAVAIPGGVATTAGTTGIPILSWNPSQTLGSVYQLRANIYGDVINRFWKVDEKVNTLYVKGNLDGEIGSFSYAGNIGLQMQNTKQVSTGFRNDASLCTNNQDFNSCAKIAASKSYTDYLPSLNLNFDLGNDHVVRIGAAKVLARAKMSDLRANIGFGLDNNQQQPNGFQGVLSGGAGNPNLEPFRANQFDVSYEKYFGGSKGYVSVAAFHKKLTSYIYNRIDANFDFTPFINASTALPANGNRIGRMNRPENGTGGRISGVEFAVNVPFSLVAAPLEGFGVFLNHSDTSSSIKIPTSGLVTNAGTPSLPLPGLSRKVTNLRVYYERFGFQVAVAGRTRSDFLGDITDFKGDRQLEFIKGETTVDLQLGYEFQAGFAKGLSLSFQANNVTNTKFERYTNTPANITDTKKFGKTYLFGANYKF